MKNTNNREATLRLTRPLRRDINSLTRRVRLLERLVKEILAGRRTAGPRW